MHLRVLVAVAGVPLASSHGQMMHPPNWFMTDGLPRVCPMSDGANWTLGAMWYTNYTHVPVGVPVTPDGDPRRTFTDYSNSIQVTGPAYGTPAPCVIGGRAYGPDAVDLYNQGQLAQNIKRTRWQRGAVVEAAYTLYSNHAGGYSYRLCKQSANANVTEECFEAGHLDFVGDTHIIQWGADKSSRREIPAVYTSNGTHPAGSMWARGPIPTCAGANGGYVWRHGSAIDCEPYPWRPENLRQTQFPPPLPGLYGWGTDYKPGPNNHWPFLIIDRLQVPLGLPSGDYVLSWRWDCEQGAQVWTTCADIELVDHAVEEKEWAAWDVSCARWPPRNLP